MSDAFTKRKAKTSDLCSENQRTGNCCKVKQILIDAMIAGNSFYNFKTKEDALNHIDIRVWAARNMLRIDKIEKQLGGNPYINMSFGKPVVNAKYWQAAADKYQIESIVNDLYGAVIKGLENSKSKLDCLGAMHSAYYIAAAKTLGRVSFNGMFPAPLKIGAAAPFPFLTAALDPNLEKAYQVGDEFNRLAQKKYDHPLFMELLDDVRKQLADFEQKKLINPMTGDFAYFTNSRFYLEADPYGPWQGENTIVYVDEKGNVRFTGMGLGKVMSLDDMKTRIGQEMNVNLPKEKDFITALAGRGPIKASAEAKNQTPEVYAKEVVEAATKLDVGLLRLMNMSLYVTPPEKVRAGL